VSLSHALASVATAKRRRDARSQFHYPTCVAADAVASMATVELYAVSIRRTALAIHLPIPYFLPPISYSPPKKQNEPARAVGVRVPSGRAGSSRYLPVIPGRPFSIPNSTPLV